ncbi:MAG TPA: hypothetical protein VD816_02720 [Ohtaekwangia sp.]|nr:hypothetical protein [Ohtaekwangia sp.]
MAFEPNFYTALWRKYRPVILKLMVAAAEGPQHYQLFVHEFKSAGSKQKGGYTFLLEMADGKALNNIKDSAVAKDLMAVLQQSRTASELMTTSTYAFSLDKHFVLHVNKKDTPSAQPTDAL